MLFSLFRFNVWLVKTNCFIVFILKRNKTSPNCHGTPLNQLDRDLNNLNIYWLIS